MERDKGDGKELNGIWILREIRKTAGRNIGMARVANFIYCMNAYATNEGANAAGILTALSPKYIPGEFSFSILCSLVDLEEGDHEIVFQFSNPDDQILANVRGDLTVKKNEDENIPREYRGMNVCVNLMNILMQKAGLYKTKVMIDGKNSGDFEIFVQAKNERA